MLYEIDFKFDRAKVLEELFLCEFSDFESTVKRNNFFDHIPQWQRATAIGKETNRISSILENKLCCKLHPKFYIMESGFELPFHRDETPSISINFLLKGDGPITFKNEGDIYYKTAIVDIKQEHMVKSSHGKRYLLKLPSFDDIDYKTAIARWNTNG